jgi:hypothetical protein
MNLLDWECDFLPEHFWIELLANEYKNLPWHDMYNDFLDKLEKTIDDKSIILYGYMTDFGEVPHISRERFVKEHNNLIYNVFFKPIGKILTFYPECPANWLILEEWKNLDKIDFEAELNKLSACINRLMSAKDLHTGHIRAIPLNRQFQHQKLFLNKGMEVTELIPKYPINCTDDEKYHVQSFARNNLNMIYMTEERYKEKKWPKYFWRHNIDLIPCVPTILEFNEKERVLEENYTIISKNIEQNCNNVSKYLDKLGMQYKYDLYDPIKDEILLGLFSRMTRLYVLYLTGPNLWARDISGIFLRCFVDTAITFAYLTKKGKEDDFLNFKKFSEGKEKLLLLHLQDSFKKEDTVEGKEAEEIAEELGGSFSPEFIDIELSDWTRKSTYKLSKECDFEKYYKLIYDPASSDLHGTWTSIKKSNLVYCRMSLHRFHRMPSVFEPPLYLNPIRIISEIYLKCHEVGAKILGFPKIDEELREILNDQSS